MTINLSRPDITEKEIQAVCDVLRTPNLSLGPKLAEFEQKFCEYIGTKRAVAVNSGTSGLFLCASALGIGEGDEVITTPFTFIATVTSIMMVGATPVFADIDPVTLNLDPDKIEAKITKNTKAILPVEVFGNPSGFDRICEIANKHNLVVLEDSCEALGSQLNGKKAGTFGKMSTFAFYPNKQMTTGEGGIILTDDDELADMCLSLRNQGRAIGCGWLSHERLGYNYRLSDINCALGIVQLSRIEEFKAKRKDVFNYYNECLQNEARVIRPTESAGCDTSWFVYVIRLADEYSQQQRDEVIHQLSERDIQAKNYFPTVLDQPFIAEQIKQKPENFPITEAICKSTIALPFYNNLPKEEIKQVCQAISEILDKI